MSAPAPTVTTTEKLKGKFKVFDVASFTFKQIEVNDIEFVAPATTEEAFARLGNDSKAVLTLLTDALRARAINSARPSAPSKAAVLDFIKGWRNAEPFRSMVTASKGEAEWKPQYNAQTDAILAKIKADVPALVEYIKTLPSGGDEDDE